MKLLYSLALLLSHWAFVCRAFLLFGCEKLHRSLTFICDAQRYIRLAWCVLLLSSKFLKLHSHWRSWSNQYCCRSSVCSRRERKRTLLVGMTSILQSNQASFSLPLHVFNINLNLKMTNEAEKIVKYRRNESCALETYKSTSFLLFTQQLVSKQAAVRDKEKKKGAGIKSCAMCKRRKTCNWKAWLSSLERAGAVRWLICMDIWTNFLNVLLAKFFGIFQLTYVSFQLYTPSLTSSTFDTCITFTIASYVFSLSPLLPYSSADVSISSLVSRFTHSSLLSYTITILLPSFILLFLYYSSIHCEFAKQVKLCISWLFCTL